MSDLQARRSPQREESVGPVDLAFVAFVVIILALAVMLTLTRIYLHYLRQARAFAPRP